MGAQGCLSTEEARPLPKRAHQTWQYTRPIRRYDHYCRWLTNCIGLLNHREFVLMCTGLAVIGVVGAIIDAILVYWLAVQGSFGTEWIFIGLHSAYSIALLYLGGPILKIHIGLVRRNELANEWKSNINYMVSKAKRGL